MIRKVRYCKLFAREGLPPAESTRTDGSGMHLGAAGGTGKAICLSILSTPGTPVTACRVAIPKV